MNNATDQAIGTQIQSLRVFAGLDILSAAVRLRIAPEELKAYEGGQRRPQPSLLLSMAECYGVPPSRLFDVLSASHNS
ncbi:MAG: helix-turn-helix transcriptional regulator [Terriglobus roseus]|nr:helix-turn-helix transcriptional regulator [Terriglobus roseus]